MTTKRKRQLTDRQRERDRLRALWASAKSGDPSAKATLTGELRRAAKGLRQVPERETTEDEFTAADLAEFLEGAAQDIEDGTIKDEYDEEEETPNELLAKAKQAKEITDLLKRHDAGCLDTLFKRWSK